MSEVLRSAESEEGDAGHLTRCAGPLNAEGRHDRRRHQEGARNRAPLEEALRRAPTDDWTVRVFPDANHLFQEAETGSPDEYFRLPPQIASDVLDTISGWIVERAEA